MTDDPAFLTGEEVRIEPKRLLCPSHGEHLRAHWPKGFVIIGIRVFQEATTNPELWKACGYVGQLTEEALEHARHRLIEDLEGETAPEPKVINAVTESKPLCYFLDDDQLRSIFREARLLEVRRCDLCGRTGDAGPYSYTLPDETPVKAVVCLECMIAAGKREHAAQPDGGNWQ